MSSRIVFTGDQNCEFKAQELNNRVLSVGALTADRVIQLPNAHQSVGFNFHIVLHEPIQRQLSIRSASNDINGFIIGHGNFNSFHEAIAIILPSGTFTGTMLDFVSDGINYYVTIHQSQNPNQQTVIPISAQYEQIDIPI